ncbi:MAG: ATPase, T2SS/T4P/T4SS family [Candidatus Thorarchaeota archaeon]
MNLQDEEHRIQVISCPSSRCKECSFASELSWCGKIDPHSVKTLKILVYEPSRQLVHLTQNIDGFPSHPPWEGNQWETVYLDLDDFQEDNIIEAYFVGPYLTLFSYSSAKDVITHYSFPRVRTALEYSMIYDLLKESNMVKSANLTSRIGIQKKLETIAEAVSSQVSYSFPEIKHSTRNVVSQIISHKSVAIKDFFPLIMDDSVEEIYVDRVDSPVYFDHRDLGRINTTWQLNGDELKQIVTFLRAESNLHLDRKNPSLKTDIYIFDVPLRVSISLPPLASEGGHLEIRRARVKPYTILELIRNGTLSVEAAAILVLAINLRLNITITGEPGSGKTTLMNALDSTTPKEWRKIYIEDAIESRRFTDHHQVRVKVDPVEEIEGTSDKTTEIVKSLHKSPDYLILGEIQTAEHSQALFNSLAAGLHSIQTCHSASTYSLVTRWNKNHGIDQSSLALMDVLVSLERPKPAESKRYVREIVEVKSMLNSGLTEFVGLNTIYDGLNPRMMPSWSDDGSFRRSTLAHGMKDHSLAFDFLVNLLQDKISNGDSEDVNFGKMLWANGHPLLMDSMSPY